MQGFPERYWYGRGSLDMHGHRAWPATLCRSGHDVASRVRAMPTDNALETANVRIALHTYRGGALATKHVERRGSGDAT